MEKLELLKVTNVIYEEPKNGCTMGFVEIGEEIDFSDVLDVATIETLGEFESLESMDATGAPLEALKKYTSVSEKTGESEFLVTEYVLVTSKFYENDDWVRSILIAFADGLSE